ncbi:MAG TPA: carbohydrate ABC transporter permease [Clostridiales bacterium]|nr:carbohydrate ABC transporter permease [Clostridiales bacterium]
MKRLSRIFSYILLTFGSLLMLSPLLWMLATALTPNTYIAPVSFIPKDVTFENFVEAWNFPRVFDPKVTMGTFFLNTLFVTVSVTLIGIVVDSMAGYAIARKQFAGRMLFTYAALATLMVPIYVVLVPQYLIVRRLNWLNSYKALIIPFLASGMGIHLFRSHFLSIPMELEECAKLDGASDFRIYMTIIMPISKPVIGTMAILKSMWAWNIYVWPLVVITDLRLKVIQQGLTLFQGLNITQWGYLCAGMTIAIFPLIIVFLFMQRQFIGGLVAGAIKG